MLQTSDEEQGASKLAEFLEDVASNPEKAAQRIEAKTETKGVFRAIIDFIKDYRNKGDLSDEEWVSRQLSKPEFAETLEGGTAEAAAKALVNSVEDYENAKKSLKSHLDLGGTRESWLAQQIEIGAANNGEDPAEYAKKIAQGFKEARDENAEFLLDIPATAKEEN